MCPGHQASEAPHLSYILDTSHSMNDTTGGKKKERLEERMGHQVEDTGGIGSGAAGEEHVSKLAYRGVCEDFLDIGLDQPDRCGEDSREGAHDCNNQERSRCVIVERSGSRHHVDTRRYHCCRVDQGANRRGTLHRIGQPHIKRELRRLAGSSCKQEKADGGQNSDRSQRFDGEVAGVFEPQEHSGEIDPFESPVDQHNGEDESEIADTIYDECFLCSICSGFPREPKTDEEVGAQSNALPSNKHEEVIVGQDQRKHEEDEQVQIGKIAVETFLVLHVTRGVHVDKKSNAGDDEDHQARKVIQHEPKLCLEAPRLNPREVIPKNGQLVLRQTQHRSEFPKGKQERQTYASQSDAGDRVLRQTFPDNTVERGTE